MFRRALQAPHARLLARGAAAAACGCTLNYYNQQREANCLGWPFNSSNEGGMTVSGRSNKSTDPGDTINGYLLGKTLGEGAFAIVRHATDIKSGIAYACKLVMKDKSDPEMLAHEVAVLETVGRHKHIVGLVDKFDASPKAWALIFDLVSGGEVFDRICDLGNYSEKEAAAVVRQVALALQHCHGNGVVHRDLKPENLLQVSHDADSDVKICDFGLAEFTGSDAPPMTGRKGTIAYMAPEVFRGEAYGSEVDLWALGVIMFILLAGYHPFDPGGNADDNLLEKRVRLMDWGFKGPEWKHVSRDAKNLIRKLLDIDPQKRASIHDVLNSKWVSGGAASAAPLAEGTVTKLREFNEARRTWRAAIRAATLVGRAPMASDAMAGRRMSRDAIPPSALEELKEAFKAYDTDGSGTIDLQELKSVMENLGAKEGEAELVMKSADTMKNGVITFDEFCAAVGPVYEHSHVALRRAFNVFDADRNGSIDRAELRTMLTKMKLLPADHSDAAFESMWKLADTNKDGQISFEEFVKIFHRDSSENK